MILHTAPGIEQLWTHKKTPHTLPSLGSYGELLPTLMLTHDAEVYQIKAAPSKMTKILKKYFFGKNIRQGCLQILLNACGVQWVKHIYPCCHNIDRQEMGDETSGNCVLKGNHIHSTTQQILLVWMTNVFVHKQSRTKIFTQKQRKLRQLMPVWLLAELILS